MGVWVSVDRCRLPAVVVALGCIGVGGLVVAHPGSAPTRASCHMASGPGCVNATMGKSSGQRVRAGHRMPCRRPSFNLFSPGTVVRSSAVFGDRVFLNAEVGVALANGDHSQYPALTTDGGRV